MNWVPIFILFVREKYRSEVRFELHPKMSISGLKCRLSLLGYLLVSVPWFDRYRVGDLDGEVVLTGEIQDNLVQGVDNIPNFAETNGVGKGDKILRMNRHSIDYGMTRWNPKKN